MFAVNDTVNYGVTGVCRIVEITQRKVKNDLKEFYVLKPVYDERSTIFVPVENTNLTSKMRRVLSEKEVYEIIDDMPDENEIWIDDERDRQKKYKSILQSGDRKEIVRLIKSLYKHQREQNEKMKKLKISDERIMKEAERILYDEFALVLDIKPEQVVPFIMQEIELKNKKK